MEEYTVPICSTGVEAGGNANAMASSITASVTTLSANAYVAAQVLPGGITPVAGTGYTLNEGTLVSSVGELANAATASPGSVSASMSWTGTSYAYMEAESINNPATCNLSHNLSLLGVGQ